MIHVVLYRPEKPMNTGNIMRTCVAIGATLHIIGPISFSLNEKDIKRVGLDYINNLKMIYYKDYDEFLNLNRNADTYYVTRYSKNVYSSFSYKNIAHDYYFMFGRESSGIPHDILREHLDKTIRIPMVMDARSLNLSNCVAIICYEALRQQCFYELSTSEAIKGEDFLIAEEKKNEK